MKSSVSGTQALHSNGRKYAAGEITGSGGWTAEAIERLRAYFEGSTEQ